VKCRPAGLRIRRWPGRLGGRRFRRLAQISLAGERGVVGKRPRDGGAWRETAQPKGARGAGAPFGGVSITERAVRARQGNCRRRMDANLGSRKTASPGVDRRRVLAQFAGQDEQDLQDGRHGWADGFAGKQTREGADLEGQIWRHRMTHESPQPRRHQSPTRVPSDTTHPVNPVHPVFALKQRTKRPRSIR